MIQHPFDEVLELLYLGGRSLPFHLDDDPRSMGEPQIDARNRREFYASHSSLMEPWDGPACVTFTDGHQVEWYWIEMVYVHLDSG